MNLIKALNKLRKIKTPKGFMTCITFNKEHYFYDKVSFTKIVKGKLSDIEYTFNEFTQLLGTKEHVEISTIKHDPY